MREIAASIAERLDTLEWRIWVGMGLLAAAGVGVVILAVCAALQYRDFEEERATTDDRLDGEHGVNGRIDALVDSLLALRTDVEALQALSSRQQRPTPMPRIVEPKTAPIVITPEPVEGPQTQPAEVVIDRQHEELTGDGDFIERQIGAHTFRMRRP